MAAPKLHQRLTVAEYLAFEETSEVKNEFLDGEIYAMAGGTITHSRIGGNVYAEMRQRLKGQSCEAFSEAQRLMPSEASGDFMYPDAMAVCGEIKTAQQDPNAITNPVLIVEILSDSTAAYDRGGKFYKYRQIETLQEYVLIEQKEPIIDVFKKNEQGQWVIAPRLTGLDNMLALESLGIKIPFAEIYAKVQFEEAE